MPHDFLWLGCEVSHDWKSSGGCNAGCGVYCTCSVPVHECGRCGECDYGNNPVADNVRAECSRARTDE